MMPAHAKASLILFFVAISLVSGCSEDRPATVPVSGRVLIDGEPLGYGFVRFHIKGHRPAQGKLTQDGRFRLTTYQLGDGCAPGKHVVTTAAVEGLSETEQRWHAPKNLEH